MLLARHVLLSGDHTPSSRQDSPATRQLVRKQQTLKHDHDNFILSECCSICHNRLVLALQQCLQLHNDQIIRNIRVPIHRAIYANERPSSPQIRHGSEDAAFASKQTRVRVLRSTTPSNRSRRQRANWPPRRTHTLCVKNHTKGQSPFYET